jgi:hypothetical protein
MKSCDLWGSDIQVTGLEPSCLLPELMEGFELRAELDDSPCSELRILRSMSSSAN